MPRSAATATTSRLVDVPIEVAMPPIDDASPIGINKSEAAELVFRDTLIRIGSSRITTGVLLTKALSAAASTRVLRKVSRGLFSQRRASSRPTGSSAPVRTSACPAIISEQTATSAWCPKPRNRWLARSRPSSIG